MNAATLPASQLAVLLADSVAGSKADAAAVRLIAAHGHFLRHPAFRRIIAAGSSICPGEPVAVIRWHAAIHALDTGRLCATRSEAAILRIAASLADEGIPVHLRQVLGGLEQRNLALITTAITAANGS